MVRRGVGVVVTPERKKEKICAVRLTKKEYAYFVEMAFKLRRSLSDVIRISLHSYIVENAKTGTSHAK